MNRIALLTITAMGTLSICSAASAQIAGTLGAPVSGVGSTVTAVSGIHHAIPAPIVNGVVPAAAPLTDGVTYAVGNVGTGLSGTGQQVSANGVTVGTPNTRPLASVGATNPANQGSVVAIGNQ